MALLVPVPVFSSAYVDSQLSTMQMREGLSSQAQILRSDIESIQKKLALARRDLQEQILQLKRKILFTELSRSSSENKLDRKKEESGEKSLKKSQNWKSLRKKEGRLGQPADRAVLCQSLYQNIKIII